MNNIPDVASQERPFSGSTDGLGAQVPLRPEKRTVEWSMDPVFRFCKAGDLALDTCAGTLTATDTCLQLPENRWFIECDNDATCFRDAVPSLVEL